MSSSLPARLQDDSEKMEEASSASTSPASSVVPAAQSSSPAVNKRQSVGASTADTESEPSTKKPKKKIEPFSLLNYDIPDLFCLIARELSTRDCLALHQALLGAAGLASSIERHFLAYQRGLYVMADKQDYHANLQYHLCEKKLHRRTEQLTPHPKIQSDLPIEMEQQFSLGYNEVVALETRSRRSLSSIFPRLRTLKIALQTVSDPEAANLKVYLNKLCLLVRQFSPQLRSLIILLSSKNSNNFDDDQALGPNSGPNWWPWADLAKLISTLNGCKWPHLEHFTLSFEDSNSVEPEPEYYRKLSLLTRIRECYLRVPLPLLLNGNLSCLQANRRLVKIGLIIQDTDAENNAVLAQWMFATPPPFAAKFDHFVLANGQLVANVPKLAGMLTLLTGITAWDLVVESDEQYELLLGSLAVNCPRLKHLTILVSNYKVNGCLLHLALSLKRICLPSVTSLKLTFNSDFDNSGPASYDHRIVFKMQANLAAQFPALQELTLEYFDRCINCRCFLMQATTCKLALLTTAMIPMQSLKRLVVQSRFGMFVNPDRASVEDLRRKLMQQNLHSAIKRLVKGKWSVWPEAVWQA